MSLPIHNMMPKLTTSRAPRPHQSRLVICTLFGSMTRPLRTVGAIFTSRGRRHVDLNQARGCRSSRPALGGAERLAWGRAFGRASGRERVGQYVEISGV